MGKFDLYKVDLKNMKEDVREYYYLLDTRFFVDIDGTELQKGKVNVRLEVKKLPMMFEFSFQLEGVAIVPCDRCLDDVEIPIVTQNRLVVKFGKDFSEESDEVVIIPEDEGVINLAWFMYEFVALAIPIKHVHAPGKCNKTMSSKLKKHSVKSADDEEDFDMEGGDDIVFTEDDNEDKTDSRWDALKGLIDKE